ncbi:unnamed protein product [Ilex paraguariensis]|uniref:ATPase inhibitor n=1 Tax=Ilex paraguariensis TaxID=185542 RepID=A0ABC8UHZ2_9AQUA
MAMRSVVSRISFRRFMETSRKSTSAGLRYFSDGKGRILSEEERAKETVYIHKMEKERLEKQKLKEEKERAEKEKAEKEKSDKKAE